MKSVLITIIVLCLGMAGCASTLRLQPVAAANQTTTYKEGAPAVISQKQSIVAIRPSTGTYSSAERPTFVVSVFNGTTKPTDFSTENIAVTVVGTPLKVFTHDELVAEVKNQQMWAAIAVGLAGASQSLNAASAGNQYSSGRIGRTTYTAYTYNAAAANQAQAAASAQTAQNLESLNASANATLSELSATILKQETVIPNQWYGGYIKIEKPPAPDPTNTIDITVSFGGEAHAFQFTQTQVQ